MKEPHVLAPRSLLDVEIRHLRLMVALTEAGSVTRAAQTLHLTQSALSHQLSDLEQRLGVQLFRRGKPGVSATAAGRQLLKVAYDVLARLNAAQAELGSLAGAGGTLRIATQCYTCYHWLPQVWKRLREEFPGVEIDVRAEATRRPLEALADGGIDLALMYTPVKRASFVARRLFDDELVAVMSPQHPLAARPWLRAADFAAETVLLYDFPLKEMYVYRAFFHPAKVVPRRVVQMQLTEGLMELAKANSGIAVLTRWSVAPEVRAGRLVAVPLERAGLHRPWMAVYRKHKATPPYYEAFVRLLKSAFPVGPALPPLSASLG